MLLTLRDVSKRFGLRTILHRINFDLAEGERLLLVGGNGAGKSTLLRIMAGLSRATEGQVERGCEADELGYVGHGTCLYPGLTALENLTFWCELHGHGVDANARMDMLRKVGLARFARERAGTFSRGMAQRLNLARVLLQAPRLLLLDEPGTGLDTTAMALLHEEIGAAGQRQAGVIWISHDMTAALPHVDRVVALQNRLIAFDGSPEGYRNWLSSQEAAC